MVFGGYTYLIGIRLIGSVIGENIRTYHSPLDSYRFESQAEGSLQPTSTACMLRAVNVHVEAVTGGGGGAVRAVTGYRPAVTGGD